MALCKTTQTKTLAPATKALAPATTTLALAATLTVGAWLVHWTMNFIEGIVRAQLPFAEDDSAEVDATPDAAVSDAGYVSVPTGRSQRLDINVMPPGQSRVVGRLPTHWTTAGGYLRLFLSQVLFTKRC